MDETKSLSGTEGPQPPADGSASSSAETKSLSGTDGSQQLAHGSSGSSDGDTSNIGRYRIVRPIGQGGFGRVYLGHDDDLDRPVAIKVPNPERISRREDVESFLIETVRVCPQDKIVALGDIINRGPDSRWRLSRAS